jgi:hypothetical protein
VDQEFLRWAEKRETEWSRWVEKREAKWCRWAEKRDRQQREFLDSLTERHVGITQEMIGALDRLTARVNAGFAQLQAEIADQREQIQANTEALLRVLGRLEPRGS